MLLSISLITAWRIPPKIAKNIVLIIAIIMTPFFSSRAFTSKGFKDQSMDAFAARLSTSIPEKNKKTTVPLILSSFLKTMCFCRTHATQFRNFISSFIASDGFPFFHSANLGINNVSVKAAY